MLYYLLTRITTPAVVVCTGCGRNSSRCSRNGKYTGQQRLGFVDQLRYKINKSDPFNVVFTRDQTKGDNRQVMYFAEMPGFDQNKFYDLRDALKIYWQVMIPDMLPQAMKE